MHPRAWMSIVTVAILAQGKQSCQLLSDRLFWVRVHFLAPGFACPRRVFEAHIFRKAAVKVFWSSNTSGGVRSALKSLQTLEQFHCLGGLRRVPLLVLSESSALKKGMQFFSYKTSRSICASSRGFRICICTSDES